MSLADVPVRERLVRANGLLHHVIEWGDEAAREVVLLAHGFLDLAWGFALIAPRLVREGRKVVAFDWRGHGESEWVGRGGYYHFVDYVLDLHELVPQISSVPLHLVGHSMGGTASTLYAATHPERIRTLSLLEGLGPPAEDVNKAPDRVKRWLTGVDAVRRETEPPKLRDLAHARERLLARNAELDPDFVTLLAEKGTRPHPSGDGLAWRFDPLHRTASPMGFEITRFMQFVRLIEAPTLVIAGEQGMRVGDDDVRLAALKHGKSAVIGGAGHMMHWTHAMQTAALLAAYLDG